MRTKVPEGPWRQPGLLWGLGHRRCHHFWKARLRCHRGLSTRPPHWEPLPQGGRPGLPTGTGLDPKGWAPHRCPPPSLSTSTQPSLPQGWGARPCAHPQLAVPPSRPQGLHALTPHSRNGHLLAPRSSRTWSGAPPTPRGLGPGPPQQAWLGQGVCDTRRTEGRCEDGPARAFHTWALCGGPGGQEPRSSACRQGQGRGLAFPAGPWEHILTGKD